MNEAMETMKDEAWDEVRGRLEQARTEIEQAGRQQSQSSDGGAVSAGESAHPSSGLAPGSTVTIDTSGLIPR